MVWEGREKRLFYLISFYRTHTQRNAPRKGKESRLERSETAAADAICSCLASNGVLTPPSDQRTPPRRAAARGRARWPVEACSATQLVLKARDRRVGVPFRAGTDTRDRKGKGEENIRDET